MLLFPSNQTLETVPTGIVRQCVNFEYIQIIDVSQGNEYYFQVISTPEGNQLLSDYEFGAGCGASWQCGQGWNISGGQLVGVPGTTTPTYQTLSQNAGYYMIKINVNDITGGGIWVKLFGTEVKNDGTTAKITEPGTYYIYVYVTSLINNNIEIHKDNDTVVNIESIEMYLLSMPLASIKDTNNNTVYSIINYLYNEGIYDTEYHGRVSFIFAKPQYGINDGCYYLSIDDIILTQTVYNSNIFFLSNTPKANLIIQISNNNNMLPVWYNINTQGIINKLYFTLALNRSELKNIKYEYPLYEQYMHPDTSFDLLVGMRNKLYDLIIYNEPAHIHDFISLGLIHDEFIVNNSYYTKADNSAYEPTYRNTSNLSTAIITIKPLQENTLNINC